MPKRYNIVLTEQEKQKLEGWLKNPPSPYLRERARAILKVSQGETIQATAEKLRVRIHRNAVSEWVKRFLSDRLEGLKIKRGRGRKSVFSPNRKRRSQTAG
ncbi:MAG: helix-turn-helix domain-containing protein [Nitrososphaera sp.]|nr:helix-turn-helix domain-containing protein [Nitrososphaera sp.]